MNQKGSIQDLIYIAGIGMATVIAVIAVGYMFSVASTAMYPIINETSPRAANMLLTANTVSSFFINLMPFVLIFMGIAAALLAYFVPTHPIFIGISVVLLVLIIYGSFYFSNIAYDFFITEGISTYMNDFPLVYYFFVNLPLFTLGFGAIILIVMYSRWRGGSVVDL